MFTIPSRCAFRSRKKCKQYTPSCVGPAIELVAALLNGKASSLDKDFRVESGLVNVALRLVPCMLGVGPRGVATQAVEDLLSKRGETAGLLSFIRAAKGHFRKGRVEILSMASIYLSWGKLDAAGTCVVTDANVGQASSCFTFREGFALQSGRVRICGGHFLHVSEGAIYVKPFLTNRGLVKGGLIYLIKAEIRLIESVAEPALTGLRKVAKVSKLVGTMVNLVVETDRDFPEDDDKMFAKDYAKVAKGYAGTGGIPA